MGGQPPDYHVTEYNTDYYTTPTLNPADHFTSGQLILFQVLITVVAVLGVLGNLLITCVVMTYRRWRVPTNIFLANVAIADLIICLWTLPLLIASINKGRWPLPMWLCALGGFLDNASYVCSSWSLALGSLERFYLVLSRGKNRDTMTHSVAILFAGSVWIFAIILAALPVLGWNRYVYSPLTFSCAINAFMDGIHKYYFIVFLILVLPGPLVIILFNYTYVFIFIARLPKRNRVERNNHLSVIVPLVLITLAFVLCSLPTTVIIVTLLLKPGNTLESLTPFHYNMIHWVLLFDSCINPMICAFLSRKFRGACKELITLTAKHMALQIRYTFGCHGDQGCWRRAKFFMASRWTAAMDKITKDLRSMKESVTRAMCPKLCNSDDNFVIKVTLNNRSGVSLDPLLSVQGRGEGEAAVVTQMTSIPSSKEHCTDSFKRQNSSDSRRASLENQPHGAGGTRRISGDRNPFLNDVIIEERVEELEPVLIWCTCGLTRCHCGIPATSV